MNRDLLIKRAVEISDGRDKPHRQLQSENQAPPDSKTIPLAVKVFELAEDIIKVSCSIKSACKSSVEKIETICNRYASLNELLNEKSISLLDLKNNYIRQCEYAFYSSGKRVLESGAILSSFDKIVEIFYNYRKEMLKVNKSISRISFVKSFVPIEYSEFEIVTKKRKQVEYYSKIIQWQKSDDVLCRHLTALRKKYIIYCESIQDVFNGKEIPVIKADNATATVLTLFNIWEEKEFIYPLLESQKNRTIINSFNYLKNGKTYEFKPAALDNCRSNLSRKSFEMDKRLRDYLDII